jgi:hypothetical protein
MLRTEISAKGRNRRKAPKTIIDVNAGFSEKTGHTPSDSLHNSPLFSKGGRVLTLADIQIIFQGKTMPTVALSELADELFAEIEGFGDIEESRIENFGWSILARVESANAVNAVLGAMARLLSHRGIQANSVSVAVAGKRGVLSELVS